MAGRGGGLNKGWVGLSGSPKCSTFLRPNEKSIYIITIFLYVFAIDYCLKKGNMELHKFFIVNMY